MSKRCARKSVFPGLPRRLSDVLTCCGKAASAGRMSLAPCGCGPTRRCTSTALRRFSPRPLCSAVQKRTSCSLDDPIGRYKKDAPEPGATIRQLLTHTTGTSTLTFNYRPDRIDAVAAAVKACTDDWYSRDHGEHARASRDGQLSLPGPDVLALVPPAEGFRRRMSASLTSRPSIASPLLTPSIIRGAPSRRSTGSHAHPVCGAHFNRSRLRAVRPCAAERDSAPRRHAHQFMATSRGRRRQAAAARDRLVRPELQRRAGGMAVRHGRRRRIIVDGSDAAVARAQPGDGGQQYAGLAKSFPLEKGDVTTSPFARIFLSLFTR